jgi:hypothetical protein
MEDREAINAKLPTEVLSEFYAVMAKRGIRKKQDALADAMKQWSAEVRSVGDANRKVHDDLLRRLEAAERRAAPSPHQELIDRLVHVLDSSSKDAIDAVTTNINVFYRLVKVDEAKSRAQHRTNVKLPDTGTGK